MILTWRLARDLNNVLRTTYYFLFCNYSTDLPSQVPTNMGSWKLKFFSKLADKQGLTLIVEPGPGTLRSILVRPCGIFNRWESLDAASSERWSFLQSVVQECENRFPLGAGFGRYLLVRGADDIEVLEDFHPDLLPSLPTAKALIESGGVDPSIETAP